MEKHIDFSSYEIEHYLSSIGQSNFVEIMKNYSYMRYFAASALGSDDCYDANNILLYHERPSRLELPVIWLMYQMGLTKR